MGRISGDKSRFNRQRRKKIARREDMRTLRETMGEKGAAKKTTPVPAER